MLSVGEKNSPSPFYIKKDILKTGSRTIKNFSKGIFIPLTTLFFLILVSCASREITYKRSLVFPPEEVKKEAPPQAGKIAPEEPSPPPSIISRKKVQEGVASWYGPGFHGKPSASGEIYDMYSLTAAHPTLPMGTYVLVTNLKNQKSVEVMISDRGPFLKGRVIDLSYSAARLLDIVDMGTALVRIEILNKGPVAERADFDKIEKGFTIQVGSFINKESAMLLQRALVGEFPDVRIDPYHSPTNLFYRVRIGEFMEKEEAMEVAMKLVKRGYNVIIISLSK